MRFRTGTRALSSTESGKGWIFNGIAVVLEKNPPYLTVLTNAVPSSESRIETSRLNNAFIVVPSLA